MKRKVGLWIDHRKTFVVSFSDKGQETALIRSDMEKHVRYSGAAQEDSAEDQRDNRFTGHLNKYYDHVVSCIRDAESILILGPGEATGELEKRLESEALSGRMVRSVWRPSKLGRSLMEMNSRTLPPKARTGPEI